MSRIKKLILKITVFIIFFAGLGYAGFLIYNYIIEDATKRIRASIVSTINPLTWPKRIFGGK